MPKKKKTEEKSLLKKKPRKKKKSKENEEEIKEKESSEEPLNITIDLSEESTLEELAEQPEISETETAEFSEFMVPETSDMPTLTLPSSPSSPSLAELGENLEESASSSIATTSGTVSPVREGGNRNLYSGTDYGEYFGKSYSETNYKPREEEIRNLLKQNIAEKPIMPVTPVSQRSQDDRIQQVNIEDWGRGEKELRDYTIESIAKKEGRKRKMID